MRNISLLSGIVHEHADARSIPRALMDRLVEVESDWDQWAVRYEPQYTAVVDVVEYANHNRTTPATENVLQKCSWGPCQVLGATARRLGYTGPLPQLADPHINVALAALLLAELRNHGVHHRSWRWVITAYNHGPGWEQINPRWDRAGYTSQYYAVLAELGEG